MEYLDLVNLKNEVVGRAARSEVRQKNLLHRGVGVLCWNSAGQLYVHQRTSTKDLFPSMYDMMVGGAVAAGEPYETAARREIEEELGVVGLEPECLLEHLYDGPKNRSFVRLYEVVWDGPIRWQPEEICWGAWLDWEDVLPWLDTVAVVPDGLSVFEAYLALRATGLPQNQS